MTDCFFDDTAPGCDNAIVVADVKTTTTETAMNGGGDHEPMEVGFWYGWEAQLAYTMTAAWGVTWAALDLWRYNDSVANTFLEDGYETYYSTDSAEDNGTFNYYKVANLIWNYGNLTLWGWAVIIQLIANFGVLNDINILTWAVILPLGFALVNLVAGILFFVNYNN